MSDDTNDWAALREESKQRRWGNRDSSLKLLHDRGIPYELLNEAIGHYRVKGISFWPTTGKFYDPKTGRKGRGVFNLIKLVS